MMKRYTERTLKWLQLMSKRKIKFTRPNRGLNLQYVSLKVRFGSRMEEILLMWYIPLVNIEFLLVNARIFPDIPELKYAIGYRDEYGIVESDVKAINIQGILDIKTYLIRDDPPRCMDPNCRCSLHTPYYD